jgi:hypothetical protein
MAMKSNSYPSVRHLRLSQHRISKVLGELFEDFRKSALGRRILTPVYLSAKDERRDDQDFISIGVSHILDKIWFVDGTSGDTFYGYQGIGGDYGRGLAEAEASHIVKCILENCRNNRITFKGEIQPSDILRSLEVLESNKMEARIILTNVHDHVQLWHHRNMIVDGQLGIAPAFSGYGHKIGIEFFRGLPSGTSIVVNPYELGELLIRKTVEDVATISEIEDHEKPKLLKELPSMTVEKLDESVRFLVYEVIKVSITNPKAVAILQKEEDTTTIII